MSYVFDTSSLMAVLLDQDSPDVDVLFDEHTVELAFYEAGNVLWKATHLQERLGAEDAQRLVDILEDLRRELVVHELSELGTEQVLDTGMAYDITFYDAAHLTCAETLDATLVTEDSELQETVEDVVSIQSLNGDR